MRRNLEALKPGRTHKKGAYSTKLEYGQEYFSEKVTFEVRLKN